MRAGIRRFQLNFLDRVRIRSGDAGHHTAKLAVGQGCAVGHIFERFAHQAVGALAAGFQSRCGHFGQAEHVAPIHRQLVDALVFQCGADGAVIRGRQLHRGGGNLHLLGNLSCTESGVDDSVLRDQQIEAGLEGSHVGRRDGYLIGAGEQAGNLVEPHAVGFCACGHRGGLVDHVDHRAWDDGAG